MNGKLRRMGLIGQAKSRMSPFYPGDTPDRETSVIYVESIRDFVGDAGNPTDEMLKRAIGFTTVHEVAHQFGLAAGPNDERVAMAPGQPLIHYKRDGALTSASMRFEPFANDFEIQYMRARVRSPGDATTELPDEDFRKPRN